MRISVVEQSSVDTNELINDNVNVRTNFKISAKEIQRIKYYNR